MSSKWEGSNLQKSFLTSEGPTPPRHWEPAMISQGMMKVENLLRADEDLAHKLAMIERALTKKRRKKTLLLMPDPNFFET
jgi:hypothetical protein